MGCTFALAILLFLPTHTARAQKKESALPRSTDNRSTKNDASQKLVKASFGTPDMQIYCDAWTVCDTSLRQDICRALMPMKTSGKISRLGGKSNGVSAISNVTIFGNRQKNGLFKVYWILCDSIVFLKPQIAALMDTSLLRRIAKPFEQKVVDEDTGITTGKDTTYYCHSMLSSLQQTERLLKTSKLLSTLDISTKEGLLHLPDYAFSNISVFRADNSAIGRLREVFTPSFPRTAALEKAEQECTNTDDIKRKIEQGKTVPQALINEGSSPDDCEIVKSYYSKMASLRQIGRVYVITKRYIGGETPEILGVVSIPSSSNLNALFAL